MTLVTIGIEATGTFRIGAHRDIRVPVVVGVGPSTSSSIEVMGVKSFDHVGVVVDDLEAATTFFLDLGLDREGAGSVEGEWVEKVVGLDDVQVEFVMVKTPDGSGKLELIKFHRPADEEGAHPAPANRLGLRHVALVVDDLNTIVKGLRDKGMDTIGEVENYEDTFLLCYVRGPEGIIVELAERIGSQGPSTEP